MKIKNKFDTFDELDDFDKMLFDYFEKQDEDIPLSTQNAIKNAFNNKRKSNSTAFVMLKKVAVFILALGIITTTTVYAKDIVNFITNIFADNNRGIDTAIDNGYVQNVDMDYIVCNDVGVKVDYLLMDDKNLNISFVYKYLGEEYEIESMSFCDLIIKDENENVLCLLEEDTNKVGNINILGTTSQHSNNQQIIDISTIRDTLLFTSDNFPTTHVLSIKISKMLLSLDTATKYIDGNWIFSINIDDYIVTRNTYEYISSTNPYINFIATSLTDTSLSIELRINTLFNEMTLYNRDAITLKDENNNFYRPTKVFSQNNISDSTIILLYPITIYDDISKLYLNIQLDLEKQINLELTK